MSVREAILGTFLVALFSTLTSREFVNFAHREGILKRLEKCKKTLLMIQEVLSDA